MSMISFAFTTPALLAGRKTMTRRDWNHDYAKQFLRAFRQDDLVDAYDKSPRNYGKVVATIRLTAPPTYEPISEMPDSDYEGEGFAYLYELHPDKPNYSPAGFRLWRADGTSMYVVRFKLVYVTPYGKKLLDRIIKKSARFEHRADVRGTH